MCDDSQRTKERLCTRHWCLGRNPDNALAIWMNLLCFVGISGWMVGQKMPSPSRRQQLLQVSWSEGLDWMNATWCKTKWNQQAVCSFGISCNCQSKHHVTPSIVTCLQTWSTVDPWSLLEIVEQLAMMYVYIYIYTHTFFCPGKKPTRYLTNL